SSRSSPTVATTGSAVPVSAGRAGRAAVALAEGREALRLVRGDERVDEPVELAIEHSRQVGEVHVDAMIGQAILREVVGPDLVRPIAGADHRAPGEGFGLALLATLLLEEPRAQHGQRLGLVLVLALLV